MNWLIAHLVGDFLLQNDWMALQKKKKWFPCAVHCTIYTLTIWVFTMWPWWALPIVFATHYVFDATLLVGWICEKRGSKSFMEPPMFPWSWIAVDNTFHLLSLFLIEKLVNFV